MSLSRKLASVAVFLLGVGLLTYSAAAFLGQLPQSPIPTGATPIQEMLAGRYDWALGIFALAGALISFICLSLLRFKTTSKSDEALKRFMSEEGIE